MDISLVMPVSRLCQMSIHRLAEFSSADYGPLAVLAFFVFLFSLEALCGHRKEPAKTTRQSYLTNLGTFLLNDTLMSLMSVSTLLLLAQHYAGFGLLRFITDPVLKAVLCFVLFDLALYLWHRANHSFDCLWMFHKVHHSDQSMNVTTAFRLHFVEVVFTTVVKALFVLMTGVEAKVLLANEALITLLVMFHHANLSFKGERLLGWLIIVPHLHRLHHSVLRKEHDSNYGAAFSLWDRVFGSFAENEPKAIGLSGVPGLGVLQLMRYGLVWEWQPPAKPVEPKACETSPQFLQRMIAEAAYYRAEKRGFAPGNDRLDWLEAEKEVLSRLKSGQPEQGTK